MSNQQDSENNKFILRGKTPEELLSIYKSTNISVEALANSLVWVQSLDKGYETLILAIESGETELVDTIVKAIRNAQQQLLFYFRDAVHSKDEDTWLKKCTTREKVSLLTFVDEAELSQEENEQLREILLRSLCKDLQDSQLVEKLNTTMTELNLLIRTITAQLDENRLTLN